MANRIRKAANMILAILIALFVNGIILMVAFFGIRLTWNWGENNATKAESVYERFFPAACEARSLEATRDDRLAVIRIDDPQALVWTDIVKRMVTDATAKKARVVLGVIPNGLEKDWGFSTFLRTHSCEFEIAQHGFSHQHDGDFDQPEFDGLTESEMLDRIRKGRRVLEGLVNDRVTSFIPPQNSVSPILERVLSAMGYSVVSGYDTGEFDAVVSTYDFDRHAIVPVGSIFEKCDEKFAAHRSCVIMLHPQDYVTDDRVDEEKYRSYLELLQGFSERGVKVVTFGELQEILRR
ncbi:MAG: DUF2334 domain-containing protein [Candidatus Moranbacteria bacterium]|nr:DUF2334 domain-containing protein [Candidatus Moranbacteria bacterium]